VSNSNALNDFFIAVQARAFRQVEISVKNRDDSLDIVQEAMTKLAIKYSDRKESWGPLFQRILQNCMNDYFRKKKLLSIFRFASDEDSEDQHFDEPQRRDAHMEQNAEGIVAVSAIEKSLRALPERQRQAFILRAWWEYDTAETAFIMRCSEGSVKTHYSRAQKRLRELVEGQ